MPLATEITLFVAALVVSAFLSMAEAALLGFSRVRRHQLAEDEAPGIKAVERVLDEPQRFVLAILLMDTVVMVVGVVAATLLALRSADAAGASRTVPLLLAGGGTTLVFLIAAGFIPKAIGQRYAESVSLTLAPVFVVLLILLRPVTVTLARVAAGAYVVTGVDAQAGAAHFRGEEELKRLVALGTDDGVLDEEEEELIQSVIEFGDTTAKEVMVPRADTAAVPGDATLESVRAFALDSGFSRVPVYTRSTDNVVGVMYVKDLLMRLLDGGSGDQVKSIARDPMFVPETKKISDLLREMQEKRVHFGVVVDEFGTTTGVITMEDILEEIVGEIFDEEDRKADPVREIDNRTALVDARTNVADVNDALDLGLPEDGPFDTVGGFVMHDLGRLGREGEVVEREGFRLVIEKVSNRRILRVRVERKRNEDAGEEEAAPSEAPPG